MERGHYFDANATVPMTEGARAAWLEASQESFANAAAGYTVAGRVRAQLELCREAWASDLGVASAGLFFNAGATEGNNAVMAWMAEQLGEERVVLYGAAEHASVVQAAKRYFPGRAKALPMLDSGQVDLASVQACLQEDRPGLVSLMGADNETGVVQPWREVADLCAQAGVAFHCDATQLLGKVLVEELSRCALVTASAHKWGGPQGVGLMVCASAYAGFVGLAGGGQEHGFRSGTVNYAGVASAWAAWCERRPLWSDAAVLAQRRAWRDGAVARLREQIAGIRVLGEGMDCLWNTVAVVMPVVEGTRWVTAMDALGFAVGTGSACSTGSTKEAAGQRYAYLSELERERMVRLSAWWGTQEQDWWDVVEALTRCYQGFLGEGDGSSLTEVISI